MALPKAKKPQARSPKKIEAVTQETPVSSFQRKQLPKPTQTFSGNLNSTKNTSHGGWFLFFVLLVLAVLGWSYREQLSSIITTTKIDTGKNISGANNLFVGKDIILTGTVQRATNNRYSYTHTLDDATYGILGLRSSNINLYGLEGEVKLSGRIVEFSNNLYVVEIKEIMNEDSITQSGVSYYPVPGLLLQDMTKDGFSITQNTTTQSLAITNPATKAYINIRYFPCSNEKTYNCAQFEESFKNTSGSRSVDDYGNIFYKLNDENTWFANIDKRYGIYIETSNAQLFPLIIENVQFITNSWAKQHLSTTAKTICKEEMNKLQEITSGTIQQTGQAFMWIIEGTDTNFNKISCQLVFDPEDLADVTASLVAPKPTISTGTLEQDPIVATGTLQAELNNPSSSLPSSSQSQFPLRPGKELLFSTRGMTLSFPSPNISFVSTNISESVSGVKCSVKTSVVEYSKKDQVLSNPSVILYFCNSAVESVDSQLRAISAGSTTILIEAKDPSWTNFANAITIQ